MKNSQKKWMILVIVDILICTAILMTTSYLRSSHMFSQKTEEKAELKAKSYAQEFSGWMNGYASGLEVLASQMENEKIYSRPENDIRNFLKSSMESIDSIGEISDFYYTDISNHMICAGDYADQGDIDYVHDREWFVDAASSEDLCYATPYLDSMDGRTVITLSKGIREGDTLKGVVCADLYVDTLIDKINKADVDADSYAFLIDRNYDMVVHPCSDFKFKDTPKKMTSITSADYAVIKRHLNDDKNEMHVIKDYDGVERAFFTAVIPGMKWYVGIATSKDVLMADVKSLMFVFLAAGMAALVISVMIFLLVSIRLVRLNDVRVSEALRKFGIKNIIISLAAVVFFVALIVIYVSMLYSASKDSIIAEGELHSVESANQLNKYLSEGTALVKTANYELGKMLEKGCTEKEIQEYMVEKTDSIQQMIDPNYTGLYGYINGKYYDGANWVPDEGWVATERPWYKRAVEAGGRLTLVEPYLDAQTGLITMTAAIAMENRANVVAIDVSFSMMRTITKETEQASDKIEMVLDGNGSVIAHSDENEIGKNYLRERGTLGSAVAEKVFTTYDQCFELSYDDKDYVVYSVSVNNEWYSLTLIDSGESFRPLHLLIIITICVIVLAVVILGAIFINTSTKHLAVERLNVQLTATSNIYISMHDVDLINNRFEVIHSTPVISDFLSNVSKNATEAMNSISAAMTMADTRDEYLKFVDLSTLEERMEGKNTIAMEFHAKDGRWMRGRFIVSERNSRGRISHVLWMIESIDEEKRKRDELQDISSRALAESEAKSAFLSNMSHEIRTPITAVLGMNEMVLRECEDENIIEYAENIENAGRTLLGIINDILDFSKIEEGKMEIIPVEYDLSSLLNDLVNMTEIRAENKGLLLNINFSPDMPNVLFGDEVRIKQVITNILTNAVKYTEKGEITFSMWHEVNPREADYITLCAEVRDTGIGIKEEDMEKLFARFDRIEEKRNRNIEGTGLGMAITKHLLDLMGGKMQIESEYGVGSTFRVTLKQRVIEWNKIGDYQDSVRKRADSRDKYKELFTAPTASALIVDDTKMNLMVFKSLLKGTEMEIDTADSGIEALEILKDKKYDVIFLDHMMPHKDGIETLQELKADKDNPNLDTPVVCLTANAISGAREMYLNAGFDNYLTKPIDSLKLEEMLVAYLPKEKISYMKKQPESEEKKGGGFVKDESDMEKVDKNVALSPLYIPHKGINLIEAMGGMGGEDAFKPILDIFYETIDENADEIQEMYDTENWEDYTILVHALKSSARIVGALDLGEEAFAMEMAGKENNLDYVHKNHEKLMKNYREFKDILSDIYEEQPEIGQAPVSKAVAGQMNIDDWKERIREGADNMDIDVLEEVFREITAYELSPEDEASFLEIKKMVDSYDYDGVNEMLDSM